jgi:hypothetical protein
MKPLPNWFMLLKQEVCRAFSLAAAKTGNKIAARIAMIAITTSSSIRVKARRDRGDDGAARNIFGNDITTSSSLAMESGAARGVSMMSENAGASFAPLVFGLAGSSFLKSLETKTANVSAGFDPSRDGLQKVIGYMVSLP